MRLSGERRFQMGCDAFDAARALQRASLGEGGGSPGAKTQIFLRTYGRDFDSETLRRIVDRIGRESER